jgi:hypothetical protein
MCRRRPTCPIAWGRAADYVVRPRWVDRRKLKSSTGAALLPRPTVVGGPNSGKFDRICLILKRTANVSVGIAAGGIPWTIYDFDAYGSTVMFSGFVLYLILVDLRTQLILASKEDERPKATQADKRPERLTYNGVHVGRLRMMMANAASLPSIIGMSMSRTAAFTECATASATPPEPLYATNVATVIGAMSAIRSPAEPVPRKKKEMDQAIPHGNSSLARRALFLGEHARGDGAELAQLNCVNL